MNKNEEVRKPYQLLIDYENKNNIILKPIIHYTSAKGLQGIIKDGKKLSFWFTKSDCLNDISEGTYIKSIFEKTIQDMFNDGTINEEFYNIVKDIKPPKEKLFSFPLPSEQEENCIVYNSYTDCGELEAFVCCFSLAKDSVDMWRYYSKNDGGYALELAPFIFEADKDYQVNNYDSDRRFSIMKGFEVVYDVNEQKSIIEEYITSCFHYYKEDSYSIGDKTNNTISYVQQFLDFFQFCFKHPCFASEKEYRYVYYRPINRPKALKNDIPEIQYRIQNGMITPYIELDVENCGCLFKVMISPLLNDSNVISRTKHFLESKGFSDCKVEKSELPIR